MLFQRLNDSSLAAYPAPIPVDGNVKQLILPDAHGNTIKIIYDLIAFGVLELSEDDYNKLITIYSKPPGEITQDDLYQFNRILEEAKYNTKKFECIKFIGDILADRGNNDFLTLILLEKLGKKEVNTEIILSNHDVTFLQAFYKEFESKQGEPEPPHHRSLYNFKKMLDKKEMGDEVRSRVNSIVENHYNKMVKLLSYSINYDDKPPTFTLYSHAPVGLEAVSALAKAYGVRYRDGTYVELAQTIDAINTKFSTELNLDSGTAFAKRLEAEDKLVAQEARRLGKKREHDKLGELSRSPQLGVEKTPLRYIIWNRFLETIKGPKKGSYNLKVIHGHLGTNYNIGQIWLRNGVHGKSIDHENDRGRSSDVEDKAGTSDQYDEHVGRRGPITSVTSTDSHFDRIREIKKVEASKGIRQKTKDWYQGLSTGWKWFVGVAAFILITGLIVSICTGIGLGVVAIMGALGFGVAGLTGTAGATAAVGAAWGVATTVPFTGVAAAATAAGVTSLGAGVAQGVVIGVPIIAVPVSAAIVWAVGKQLSEPSDPIPPLEIIHADEEESKIMPPHIHSDSGQSALDHTLSNTLINQGLPEPSSNIRKKDSVDIGGVGEPTTEPASNQTPVKKDQETDTEKEDPLQETDTVIEDPGPKHKPGGGE